MENDCTSLNCPFNNGGGRDSAIRWKQRVEDKFDSFETRLLRIDEKFEEAKVVDRKTETKMDDISTQITELRIQMAKFGASIAFLLLIAQAALDYFFR